jgi:hypothetical protein
MVAGSVGMDTTGHRPGPCPAVHRDRAEHRQAHADLDLDVRVPALHAAQHDAPAGSRGGGVGPIAG